jgi:hypothetical protein
MRSDIIISISKRSDMRHNLRFTLHHVLDLGYIDFNTRLVLNTMTPLELLWQRIPASHLRESPLHLIGHVHYTLICLVDAGSQLELLLLGQALIIQGLFSVNKFLRVDLTRVDLQKVLVGDHLLEEVSHSVLWNSGLCSVSFLFFICCC